MTFETQDGKTIIYIDKDETEKEVVRAIIKASFDLADMGPGPYTARQYNPEDVVSDEEADRIMQLHVNFIILNLDFHRGRRCKTTLTRIMAGIFQLDNTAYEQDRGNPDEMLALAQTLV